jgi:16S rRNA (cytosine967-C5)-methyltransferase
MKVAISNPRDVAVLALRDRAGNVTAHLEQVLGRAKLPAVDVALARELAFGVTRRRGTLETVLRAFLERPGRRLPGALNEVLHVGLYQMLFLQRVPDFAAVNEAVSQAGRFRHRRQSGLVNGVLRTVARSVSELRDGAAPVAREAIPVGPASHRVAGRAIFPDPQRDPAGYLSAAYSLPPALARRWFERLGSLAAAIGPAAHANAHPPLILRVNRRRSDVETVLAELAEAGVPARPHANGCSVVPDKHRDPRKLEPFRQGVVQPQDPSATEVVLLAEPKPGMKVLDFCAAPGTKTTHLAELMDDRGEIVAVDISQTKLSRVEDNCRRMGVEIVRTCLATETARLEPASFDLALADVPCSNTGVLARRAEARWRFDESALGALARDQRLLLRAAGRFVRPGGRLVYSTCSIEPEEGPQVARWLTGNDPRMALLRERPVEPAGADDPLRWHDGGYVAIFEAG